MGLLDFAREPSLLSTLLGLGGSVNVKQNLCESNHCNNIGLSSSVTEYHTRKPLFTEVIRPLFGNDTKDPVVQPMSHIIRKDKTEYMSLPSRGLHLHRQSSCRSTAHSNPHVERTEWSDNDHTVFQYWTKPVRLWVNQLIEKFAGSTSFHSSSHQNSTRSLTRTMLGSVCHSNKSAKHHLPILSPNSLPVQCQNNIPAMDMVQFSEQLDLKTPCTKIVSSWCDETSSVVHDSPEYCDDCCDKTMSNTNKNVSRIVKTIHKVCNSSYTYHMHADSCNIPKDNSPYIPENCAANKMLTTNPQTFPVKRASFDSSSSVTQTCGLHNCDNCQDSCDVKFVSCTFDDKIGRSVCLDISDSSENTIDVCREMNQHSACSVARGCRMAQQNVAAEELTSSDEEIVKSPNPDNTKVHVCRDDDSSKETLCISCSHNNRTLGLPHCFRAVHSHNNTVSNLHTGGDSLAINHLEGKGGSYNKRPKKKSRPSAQRRRRLKCQRGLIPDRLHNVTSDKSCEARNIPFRNSFQSTGTRGTSHDNTTDFTMEIYSCSPTSSVSGPQGSISRKDSDMTKLSFVISAADLGSTSDSESDSEWDSVNSSQPRNDDWQAMQAEFGGCPPLGLHLPYHAYNSHPSTAQVPVSCGENEVHCAEEEPDIFHSTDEQRSREKLQAATNSWESGYQDTPSQSCHKQRRIRFDSDPVIIPTDPDLAEDYANARIGPWETICRDRIRFRDRIQKVEAAIGYCLSKEHRITMYTKLFTTFSPNK